MDLKLNLVEHILETIKINYFFSFFNISFIQTNSFRFSYKKNVYINIITIYILGPQPFYFYSVPKSLN